MATFFQYWQTYGIWSDTIHSAPEHSYPIGTVIFLSTCQLRILISALMNACPDALRLFWRSSAGDQTAGQLFLKPRHHTDTSRAIRPRDPNWHEVEHEQSHSLANVDSHRARPNLYILKQSWSSLLALTAMALSTPALIVLALVIYYASLFLFSNNAPKGLRLPPGPRGFPLIGSLFQYPRVHPWRVFSQWSKVYGRSSLLYKS